MDFFRPYRDLLATLTSSPTDKSVGYYRVSLPGRNASDRYLLRTIPQA